MIGGRALLPVVLFWTGQECPSSKKSISMSVPHPDPKTAAYLADCRQTVQARLAQVRRRLRGQLIIEGIAWALGTAVLLAGLSLALDRFVRPELSVRVMLLVLACVGAIAYIAGRRLYRPMTLHLGDLDLAELLERRQQGIGQRLTNVLLLPQLQEQDPSASPAMIQAAVREDFSALEQVDLQCVVRRFQRRRNSLVDGGRIDGSGHGAFCFVNPAIASLWATGGLVCRRRNSVASTDLSQRGRSGRRE